MNFNSGVVRDGFTRPDDESEDGYDCPWCDRKHPSLERMRECSGFKPSGMPPNETGHPYGCGCQDCMLEYQSLK